MSILNVNKINPVGGGSTITITGIASVTNNISVGNSVTAGSFVGPIEGAVTGNVTGNLTGNVTGNLTGTATGINTSLINVGLTSITAHSVGIGTTTLTGRNAGVSTASGTLIYNSSNNQLQLYDNNAWKAVLTSTTTMDATGGTKNTSGRSGFAVHTFTGSGNFVMSTGQGTVEYVIYAGGAGGGGHAGGGGGGAGGVRSGTLSVSPGT